MYNNYFVLTSDGRKSEYYAKSIGDALRQYSAAGGTLDIIEGVREAPLKRFIFSVYVDADDYEKAEKVITERLGPDEDYGFPYRIDWEHDA